MFFIALESTTTVPETTISSEDAKPKISARSSLKLQRKKSRRANKSKSSFSQKDIDGIRDPSERARAILQVKMDYFYSPYHDRLESIVPLTNDILIRKLQNRENSGLWIKDKTPELKTEKPKKTLSFVYNTPVKSYIVKGLDDKYTSPMKVPFKTVQKPIGLKIYDRYRPKISTDSDHYMSVGPVTPYSKIFNLEDIEKTYENLRKETFARENKASVLGSKNLKSLKRHLSKRHDRNYKPKTEIRQQIHSCMPKSPRTAENTHNFVINKSRYIRTRRNLHIRKSSQMSKSILYSNNQKLRKHSVVTKEWPDS